MVALTAALQSLIHANGVKFQLEKQQYYEALISKLIFSKISSVFPGLNC